MAMSVNSIDMRCVKKTLRRGPMACIVRCDNVGCDRPVDQECRRRRINSSKSGLVFTCNVSTIFTQRQSTSTYLNLKTSY